MHYTCSIGEVLLIGALRVRRGTVYTLQHSNDVRGVVKLAEAQSGERLMWRCSCASFAAVHSIEWLRSAVSTQNVILFDSQYGIYRIYTGAVSYIGEQKQDCEGRAFFMYECTT